MKKIVLILLCIIFISGCSQASTNTIEDPNNQIHEISYEELMEKLSTQDDFILYIGRPDCGDCQEFQPILEGYLNEHENEIYYVNIKSFRDAASKKDATEEEITFYEEIHDTLHFEWTPTLHHIVGNDFVSTYTYLDEDYYNIEDEDKQKEVKEAFIQQFYDWMENNS